MLIYIKKISETPYALKDPGSLRQLRRYLVLMIYDFFSQFVIPFSTFFLMLLKIMNIQVTTFFILQHWVLSVWTNHVSIACNENVSKRIKVLTNAGSK